ncbi:MAG: sigma-70 family RNA polymerase sigma factor [Solirubrobacteraceae bacterium]|nr:sigma-70 family RNA polymerase sigma factor [Solirubrobacteraceae bacterium]
MAAVDNIDDDTFAELLAEQMQGLLALARRMAPAGTDPADLVQDTLERAWRARGTLRSPAALPGWLRRILVNRVRDLGARGARRTELPLADDLTDDAASEVIEHLIVAEQDVELRAALRRTPPAETLAVVLADGEDWSASEIAELCGTTPAAMHKRIQRGRRHLAQELQHPHPPHDPPGELCASVYTLARERLAGTLAAAQEHEMDEHVATCDYCAPAVRAVQLLLGGLGGRPDVLLTNEQRARLRRAAAQPPAD